MRLKKHFLLKMTPEMFQELKEEKELRGISINKIIRTAIKKELFKGTNLFGDEVEEIR